MCLKLSNAKSHFNIIWDIFKVTENIREFYFTVKLYKKKKRKNTLLKRSCYRNIPFGRNVTIQKHCFTSDNSQLGSKRDQWYFHKPFHLAGWDSAQVSSSGRGRENKFTPRKLRYNGQWIIQMVTVSQVCQIQATNTPIWVQQVSLMSENSLMLLPSQPPASCDNHCSCLHYQSATQRRPASQNCRVVKHALSVWPRSAGASWAPPALLCEPVVQLAGSLVIRPLTAIAAGSSAWLLSIKLLQALFHKSCGHIF